MEQTRAMIEEQTANYHDEQALLRLLLENKTRSNILFLKGSTGSGKTHLIEYCLMLSSSTPYVQLELKKEKSISIASFLAKLGKACGWEQVPTLTERLIALREFVSRSDTVDNRAQELSEIGQLLDIKSSLGRYKLLAEAWYDDLSQLGTTFLLAIDDYEDAPPLFSNWFWQDFLPIFANSPHIKVLISGQSVPTVNLEMLSTELKGVSDPRPWVYWAKQGGCPDLLQATVELLVKTNKGNPRQIIDALPIALKHQLESDQQADATFPFPQLLKMMKDAFSLAELKTVCFNIGIDHEELPHTTGKGDFALEFIAAVKRRQNYLPKLLKILQEERPSHEWPTL